METPGARLRVEEHLNCPHIARYTINQGEDELTIRVTETGSSGGRILSAFQDCQDGRCDCPTDEYQKVATLSVEREANDAISVRLVPKPGERPVIVGRLQRHPLVG